jgi:hypothetical protein
MKDEVYSVCCLPVNWFQKTNIFSNELLFLVQRSYGSDIRYCLSCKLLKEADPIY